MRASDGACPAKLKGKGGREDTVPVPFCLSFIQSASGDGGGGGGGSVLLATLFCPPWLCCFNSLRVKSPSPPPPAGCVRF